MKRRFSLMKKDVVLAVLVGFILGASAALTLLNLPALFKSRENNSNAEKLITPPAQITGNPTATSPLLEITSPANESVAKTKEVKITGKTQSGNLLVLETTLTGEVLEASGDGTFSLPLVLEEGGNEIYVTVYNLKGDFETQTLTLLYSEENL